jgi:hypothetical protein
MTQMGRFEPSIILVETSACCPPALQSGRSVLGQPRPFSSAPIHDLQGRGPSSRYQTLVTRNESAQQPLWCCNGIELRVTLLGSVDRQFAVQGAIPWHAEIRVFIGAIPLAGEAGRGQETSDLLGINSAWLIVRPVTEYCVVGENSVCLGGGNDSGQFRSS